ncbi:MAG: GNAT family N-acetyltransferase [Acidimicrobiales bacterium]
MEIRRAAPEEAPAIADLFWRARLSAVPAIPPSVHPEDDVHTYVTTVLVPAKDTWVADDDGVVVGFMVLDPGWVDHLYVEPGRTGGGIGRQLLDVAKREHPTGLDLWAFQSNTGARRFYERHGFVAVARTDGDNEEGAPDVRYHWPAEDPPATS